MEEKKIAVIKNNKKAFLRGILLLLLLLAMVAVTIRVIPYIQMLGDDATRAQFESWIGGLGFRGWLILLAIQVGQIVIAFIPGEPVEIISGVLYGTMGGLLTCELGILIGTFLVFYLVKLFGKPFVNLFIKEEQLNKYHFLKDVKRLEALTFFLFLIPGTPKDALCYLIPLTPMRPSRFFLISIVARLPAVVSSTWAGATLSTGNLWGTVLIFVGIGVVALLGILCQRHVMGKMGQGGKE